MRHRRNRLSRAGVERHLVKAGNETISTNPVRSCCSWGACGTGQQAAASCVLLVVSQCLHGTNWYQQQSRWKSEGNTTSCESSFSSLLLCLPEQTGQLGLVHRRTTQSFAHFSNRHCPLWLCHCLVESFVKGPGENFGCPPTSCVWTSNCSASFVLRDLKGTQTLFPGALF